MNSDKMRLDQVVELITKKVAANKDQSRPYIGLEHLGAGFSGIQRISNAKESISLNSEFVTGDILFGKLRPNLRKCERVNFTGYCSTELLVLRARSGIAPGFAARILQSGMVYEQVLRSVEGTRMPRSSWSELRAIEIPLISFPEQQGIAEILDALDEAIRSTERLIVKLEQAKQGMLHNLMTCGIADSGQLRDARNLQLFRESSLGAIPRLWVVKRLTDIGKIRSGATPSRSMSSRYFVEDGLPWAKTLDLNEGLIFDTDERISKVAVRECSCPVLRAGTVLVAMYGGWAQIGRTGRLAVEGTINQAISSIEVIDNAVLSEYLLLALQHGRGRWKAIAASTRKDPNITRQDVLAFEVPIPPISEQEHIVAIHKESNIRIASEREYLTKLRKLKQGLMDDLLTGRVRVGVSV
jgi:type I restriction enzyme S subunit